VKPDKPIDQVSGQIGSNVVDHPAYVYWRKLAPTQVQPHAIVALKEHPGHEKKSAVYRLEGVGEQGSSIVAKRCPRDTGQLERRIHE
jgi:hypothetical protein